MKAWIYRLLAGLALALPAGLLTYALARADTLPPAQPDSEAGCATCHEAIAEAWQGGHHGQATTSPVFEEAWKAQGSKRECLTCHTTGYDPDSDTWTAEGITCQACHSPLTPNHPEQPMATDRSASLCGKCHTETLFEWQVSQHRESDLSCVGCHDPHATGLKAGEPSDLCAACHRERASNFAHTAHYQQGLTCADCHLATLGSATGEGHAVRDHSFNVKLSTCNACHAYQMHDPVEVRADEPTPAPPDALAAVEMAGVTPQPSPASPMGFAALSALLGLGAGMVLAPWLERWYRRLNRDK